MSTNEKYHEPHWHMDGLTPILLTLRILSLLQTGIETVSPTTTGGLYDCLLKAFVPALLAGLIPKGEVIWPSNVHDEPRWTGGQ